MSAERSDLAPPGDVATSVTCRCVPIPGHQAWQYDPLQKALPTWVAQWTNHMGPKVEFCDRNGSTGVYFEPGDWLVLFDEEAEAVAVYSPEEFAARFRCVFQ